MPVRSLLRVFLTVLWLWPATTLAQVEPWQGHMDAGVQTYLENNYTEAEKQLVAALKEAEGFGPQDPRLATTLNNLAALYHAQGKYADAEPLHKRALAIIERHTLHTDSHLGLPGVHSVMRPDDDCCF